MLEKSNLIQIGFFLGCWKGLEDYNVCKIDMTTFQIEITCFHGFNEGAFPHGPIIVNYFYIWLIIFHPKIVVRFSKNGCV
jgi:hypothetical protein